MQNLPSTLEERLEALHRCPYFENLEARILDTLASGTRLVGFEHGEVLFWQDEPSPGLHILHSGTIKLFKLSPNGRELVINVFKEGASFSEVPVFDRGNTPVNAAALEPSRVWIVDAVVIRQVMADHHAACETIILNLCKNLRMLVQIAEELSFFQVTQRLARLIGQLSPEQLAGPARTRITQDLLAARLGTVREVVARSLRELERSGAIRVRRGQIQVLDEALLAEWGQRPN